MIHLTRTLDGTIIRVKYDYPTLKLKGEARTPVARHRNCQGRRTNPKIRFDHELPKESIPEPPREDICEGVYFVPPTAFGEAKAEGLSVIGHAKRQIAQWEIIRNAHKENLPLLLPQIDQRMCEARDTLQKLLDVRLEANTSAVNQEKKTKKVTDRIAALEDALNTSQFAPEAENIRAAINGYRTGDIPYSSQFTLIWKGKIVDRTETYAEFTTNRLARLDSYLEAYGPHWLWWESPLEAHPNDAPRQSRCCVMERNVAYHGLGQYYIIQAFWKRADWIRRLPISTSARLPPELVANILSTEDGLLYCQSEGPKLAFASLLDSGATFPSLCPGDFHFLGIDADNYAAQTIESLQTANGLIHARTYELFVSPVDQGTMESLVDEDDAVWPYHPKYLGGLCPVTTVVNEITEPDENGFIPNQRLSGLLPFLACYVTSTPTRNNIFLGEDRNDVMGGHKTPGHRRWDISMPSTQTMPWKTFQTYRDPKIRFSHRNGMIINQDRDDLRHASTTTTYPGEAIETVVHHNPRAECDEAKARRQAEAAAQAPPPINAF